MLRWMSWWLRTEWESSDLLLNLPCRDWTSSFDGFGRAALHTKNRVLWPVSSMADHPESIRSDRLRLLEYLGLLAGLLGIIVDVGSPYIDFPTVFPLESLFFVTVGLLELVCLLTYLWALRGEPVKITPAVSSFVLLLSQMMAAAFLPENLLVVSIPEFWQGVLYFFLIIIFNGLAFARLEPWTLDSPQ